jgi:hypothetical protein
MMTTQLRIWLSGFNKRFLCYMYSVDKNHLQKTYHEEVLMISHNRAEKI